MSNKQKKTFKIIIIILVIFLIAEIVYFGFRFYNDRQNYVFYTINNDIVLTDNGYIGVGYSDYRHSDFNDFKDGYKKATVFVNEDDKLVNEIGLKLGYNSFYNDIVKTNDGYIAVGAIEMTKEQNEEKISEGLIVKYDKEFNVLWRKNVSVIGKTELFKVKLDSKGNIIVVGTSVYGEGYVGNHTTGGGILLKYSPKGKQLLKVNNGGPYNGRFNDVIVEDNGYVVVGLGKANSGIIIKYDLKGKKVWSSSYGYTDKTGINAVEKLGNNYVVATTKVVDTSKLDNYSAAIVKFDKNGKKLDDTKYTSSNITYFNDIAVSDDSIYALGYTGKLKSNVLSSDAIIVKYDKDLYEEENDIYKGEKNDFYTDLYLKDDEIIALGYSNSKSKEYDINGYDYAPIVKKYKSDLK